VKLPSYLAPLAALLPASLHAVVLVDTIADYSNAAQGINGLEYGYYTTSESETGVFSTNNVSPSGGDWAGVESFGTVRFSANYQHPAVDSLNPAVRRYTLGSFGEPSYSGLVQVTGSFGGPTPGGGGSVIGFVTIDDITLFSAAASGATAASFSFLATVSPGSTIDFGLRANGDPSFDTTTFAATVTTVVPEPSSAAVIASALSWMVVIGARRRRN
jgi:hypothetical protein